jgi:hypothetical protein
MPTPDFLTASLPLFEAGEVDVVEWSFDTAWTDDDLPPWMPGLLDDFAAGGALLGHGVAYSPLSARWEPRQEAWLGHLRAAFARRRYQRVSEHFGFMTARGFAYGAPLPVPFTDGALRVGRDRLQRLADAARVPIGLENLALAFGPDDVRDQGPFLEALLAPLDGYLVLDLHNIHCQAENFATDPRHLLATYPLARVRELHLSGGSWSERDGARVRQDTHDGPVPDPVFALLPWVLAQCPNVEDVILERLGGTLGAPDEAARFRADFLQLRGLVR